MKSKSFPSRPKIASRTGPPTRANLYPSSLNARARELANGARSTSERTASSFAAPSALLTVDSLTLRYDPGT